METDFFKICPSRETFNKKNLKSKNLFLIFKFFKNILVRKTMFHVKKFIKGS